MIKKSFHKTGIALTFLCVFLLIAKETKSENINMPVNAKDEIQISSQEMVCDYAYEDVGKMFSNFEYPKIIITDNESPIIAFIDEQSKKLIFAEVSEKGTTYLKSIPKFGDEYDWRSWPIIFVKNNEIFVAIKKENKWYEKPGVKIFLFDRKTKELFLKEDITLLYESGKFFSKDIYPYKDSYVITAGGSQPCWSELGIFFFTAHVVMYEKQHSLFLNKEDGYKKQIIDDGCFNAGNPAYSVSDSEVFQSAWVRSTYRESIQFKHNETVLFAENKTGKEWGKPLEIYQVNNTSTIWHIKDLSIANYKQSTFILWQDIRKGYFFAEVKNGTLVEVKQIQKFTRPLSIAQLYRALEAKITSDDNGNIYCLFSVQNGDRWDARQLILKSRINGIWLDDIVISDEMVRLPDIKVDKKGIIHIAYIKYPKWLNKKNSTVEELKQERERREKATCHYIKIDLNDIVKDVQAEKAN